MPALHALRQSLDVQTTMAQGVVAPVRMAAPAPSARLIDRVTISSAARAGAAAAPVEGEPTDLEGARTGPSGASASAPGSYGSAAVSSEPVRIDVFA